MIGKEFKAKKNKEVFFDLLILVFIFSCSDKKEEKKEKSFENLKVQESLENYVWPIIKTLDLEKLKKFGFNLPSIEAIDISKTTYGKPGIDIRGQTLQTKYQMESGYMVGTIWLIGLEDNPILKSALPKMISLTFEKKSHADPWKLLTYHGQIENYSYLTKDEDAYAGDIVFPEVQVYIKSKFKNVDFFGQLFPEKNDK